MSSPKASDSETRPMITSGAIISLGSELAFAVIDPPTVVRADGTSALLLYRCGFMPQCRGLVASGKLRKKFRAPSMRRRLVVARAASCTRRRTFLVVFRSHLFKFPLMKWHSPSWTLLGALVISLGLTGYASASPV